MPMHLLLAALLAAPTSPPVADPVRTAIKEGARACLVHLHGEEQQALAAATLLQQECPANLLFIEHAGQRHVTVAAGDLACKIDPNRVFTASGLAGDAFHLEKGAHRERCRSSGAVRAALEEWVEHTLRPALDRCRAGASLPVIALHNNTEIEIRRFVRPDGKESWATLPRDGNPAVREQGHGGRDLHDFFLATQEGDFAALSARHNAVLQARAPRRGDGSDDGSLSVALAGERYVNVEVHQRSGSERNVALAREALQAVGAACPAPEQQREGAPAR
jgi:hypothetical protein